MFEKFFNSQEGVSSPESKKESIVVKVKKIWGMSPSRTEALTTFSYEIDGEGKKIDEFTDDRMSEEKIIKLARKIAKKEKRAVRLEEEGTDELIADIDERGNIL